jgi:hypothetical protein
MTDQVDANLVIASLCQQIADQAKQIAILQAMMAAMNDDRPERAMVD